MVLVSDLVKNVTADVAYVNKYLRPGAYKA
jgi:hypothetical protein